MTGAGWLAAVADATFVASRNNEKHPKQVTILTKAVSNMSEGATACVIYANIAPKPKGKVTAKVEHRRNGNLVRSFTVSGKVERLDIGDVDLGDAEGIAANALFDCGVLVDIRKNDEIWVSFGMKKFAKLKIRNGLPDVVTVAGGICPLPVEAPGVWYAVFGDGNTLTASLCDAATVFDTGRSRAREPGGEVIIARSITFWSSRTLPGQW